MTINCLGSFDAGVVYTNFSNEFVSAPPTYSGAAVKSVTQSTYLGYNNAASTQIPSNVSKVVQRVYSTVTPINPIPNSPGGIVLYDPSNVVCSGTITPTNSTSTINIEFSISMLELIQTSSSYCAGIVYLYVNAGPNPLITSQVNMGSNGGQPGPITYPAIGGLSILANAYSSPITVALCPFEVQSGNVACGQGDDYMTLTEVLPQIPVIGDKIVMYYAPTTTLAFSLNLTSATNTQIVGTFKFFSLFSAGNVINFQLTAQCDGTGTVTFAQNTIIENSILPIGVGTMNPYLIFTTGTNLLEVSITGSSSGEVFECHYDYTTVLA